MPDVRVVAVLAALAALALSFSKSSPARAGTVRGTLKLSTGPIPEASGYPIPVFWPHLRNTVLPPSPPLVDIRRQMVVVIDGSGITDRLGHQPAITMRDGAFDPPVLAIRPNTKVTFENRDWVLHLLEPVKGKFLKAKSVAAGDSFAHTFRKPGTYAITCSELPHMKVTVLVLNKAQIALCDNNGAFSFPNIRQGTYKLQVWFRGKWIHSQAVTVRSGKTTLDIKLPPIKD